MIPILGGALTLVIVELLVSSPATAGRIGTLGTTAANLVARFVDPTVPMLGSTAGASSSTGGSSSSASTPAPTPVAASPSAATFTPATPDKQTLPLDYYSPTG